ncbi:hypothetical protein COO59_20435, partial [Mixta theicola]
KDPATQAVIAIAYLTGSPANRSQLTVFIPHEMLRFSIALPGLPLPELACPAKTVANAVQAARRGMGV